MINQAGLYPQDSAVGYPAAAPESIPAQKTASKVNENENSGEQIRTRTWSYVNFYGGASDAFASRDSPMMDVDGATLSGEQRWSLCAWMCLVARIRNHPSDEWVYLQGRNEKQQRCGVCTAVSLFFILIHSIGLLQMDATRPSQSNLRFSNKWAVFCGSGRGSMHRHTNAFWHGRQRSFTSTQLREPVFLLRWCEWTPLALMTFLAEAVDLPAGKVASG
jgi:hypothetical protein